MAPRWLEWDRASASSPAYVRGYGSPTIRVDGVDVAGVGGADEAPSCRVYRTADGRLAGVPAVACVVEALRRSAAGPPTP